MPVNKLTPIPKAKVRAKPRIMPEVFKNDQSKGLNKTKQVIKVQILASLIESQARPKAISIELNKGRPDFFSSLKRSKIKILASTAIPTDSKKPAIPGSVNTTGINLYKASVNIRPPSARKSGKSFRPEDNPCRHTEQTHKKY